MAQWHTKIRVSYMDAIFRNEIGGAYRREGMKYALCRAKCAKYIYINNRYFIYYYLLIQPLSPTPAWIFGIFALRSRSITAGGTAVSGRKSRMADFQRFRVARSRHGGGTAVFGAFRRFLREASHAGGTPVLGPR